tara:strand:- start:1137 stop:1637 length:501 start_codon:yes stop_codon:yes gene_type:complete
MAKAVRDKDLGYKRILKEIKKLEKKPHVKIGLLSNTGKQDKGFTSGDKIKTTSEVSVLEVGIYNEFGTDTIPSRPFMRTTHDEHNSKWFGMIRKFTGKMYEGKATVNMALEIVGQQATADMKNKIKKGPFTANAPATTKKKKSTKPLVDTAQLIGSINYQIKMVQK